MVAEQLRRLLLKEMGITSWFPRTQLPGAAPSHEPCLRNYAADGEVDGDAEARSAVNGKSAPDMSAAVRPPVLRSSAESQPATATGVAGLTQLLKQPPAAASADTGVTVPDTDVSHSLLTTLAGPAAPGAGFPDTDDSRAAVDDAPTEFAFSWFNIDRRLAVLAMLPQGDTRLSGNCRQMLMRILAALHAPWQSLRPLEQSFHWPFADDLGLPAEPGAARQAVDGFIAGRLREQKCAILLVLSDDTPWFFRQPGDSAEQPGSLRVHRQFGFAMLNTHSLHAMEQNAGLKRDAWQAMQLLRERLNRDSHQQK